MELSSFLTPTVFPFQYMPVPSVSLLITFPERSYMPMRRGDFWMRISMALVVTEM